MTGLTDKLVRISQLFVCFLLCTVSALADSYFDQGVKFYGQHKFKEAASYFEASLRNNPGDSNAVYYAAITYQQLGDWPRSRQKYRDIVVRFPESQAASLAQSVLKHYDPDFLKRTTSGSSSYSNVLQSLGMQARQGRSPDYDQLPNEGKIYFQRRGNNEEIEAQINGRPVAMYFDTGAEGCVFGKNHLQQLGISSPSGKPAGGAFGVGSSKAIAVWQMPVDLKVGNISRHNFPVMVQETMPTLPLLGESFFRDFELTTDPGASSITFKKKGAAGNLYGNAYVVPFTSEGKEIVVTVEINGKPFPMYFDTGAETICFSAQHIKQLGIAVPDDAEAGLSTGVGGSTPSLRFNVQRMKLGPIERQDVPVTVVQTAQMRHPLLGQTFYQGWQFTIDYQRHVIQFLRR